jgi:hypothetical protein
MKSADDIKRYFRKSTLSTNPEKHEEIFEKIICAQGQSGKTEPVSYRPNIGRIIMRNPIVKLVIAAVIIIACTTGYVIWTGTGSGIALADVLTRIEQVTGYAYQVDSTSIGRDTNSKRGSTVLVSKEYGIRMTINQADPNSQPKYNSGDQWYLLLQSNSIVIVSHKEKTYDRFIYDGVKLDFYKEQYSEPRAIIKQILSCEHESLGQSAIDGITVEGFQTTDLAYGGAFFGEAGRIENPQKVNVKLWVDLTTFLPVRLEEYIVTKNGAQLHKVSYDFRWNIIINPDDFEPNISEDYRAPVGDIIVYPSNEENAIKGLKLFADNFGKYPVSLERKAFGREINELMPYDPVLYKELSDEERTRRTNYDLSLAASSFFYRKLLKENNEPAYYGETVRPGDTDKVLFRWKLNDSQYRVIFGDLHAETVTKEKLAELEAALPK